MPGVFTAATAGDATTPEGTNGSFKFTVTINKGSGTEVTSAEQTMTITATPYEAPEADLTAYEAALAAVTEADYTEASWATYQEVVAANVVTVENTQAEVDAAEAAITATHADGGFALGIFNLTTSEYTSVTTITDGTFNGWIANNGTDSYSRLVIEDGVFTKMIYIASAYSDITINDGTFTSTEEALIEIDAGTLTINGGIFAHNIATNNISEIASNSGSGAFKGVIIGVKPSGSTMNTSYGSPVVINLNGGTFSNTLGDVIVLADQTTNEAHAGSVTVNVTADATITAASDKNAIAIYDDSAIDNGGCVVSGSDSSVTGIITIVENRGLDSSVAGIITDTDSPQQ